MTHPDWAFIGRCDKGADIGELHQMVQGICTRPIDVRVKALGMRGIRKTQDSRLCAELDEPRALMDESAHDVRAFMTLPRAHWPQIYNIHPLQRLNAAIKRRTSVVDAFSNDAAITRLVGTMTLE